MKTVYEILNKKYDQKLIDCKSYRKDWKERKQHLESCGIKVKDVSDPACFHYELLAYSIMIKERFEEVFFDTYVRMYDYWYDLTYQERKKQMNLDIVRLTMDLPCFMSEGQKIYMPCFDEKFNHLYTDEIILLDLKQYHTFIRTYQKQIKKDYYGKRPYLHQWCSAICLAHDEENYVLYHNLTNRFYRYTQKGYDKCLSLPLKQTITEDIRQELALVLLQDEEDALCKLLLKHEIVSKRLARKLRKLLKKKAKKQK